MSPVELSRGGNAVLVRAGADLDAVGIGISWQSPMNGTEYDVCALVCGPNRRVRTDQDFLFWDNPTSPERAVFLRQPAHPAASIADQAQILVSMRDLPSTVERVVVTLSTITADADLRMVTDLRVRLFHPASGDVLATFASDRPVTAGEACLVVTELYRHQDQWKVRAVSQGYQSGLAGLGTDYGVNIT